MDKLIFTNGIGQTIEFSSSGKYVWQSVDDIGGNEAEVQSISSPYQDGVTPVGESYFESKVIKVDFVITGEDMQDEVRELNSKLNPRLGIGSLTYEQNGIKKVLEKVKVRQLPALLRGKKKGKYFQITRIIFEIFDPIFTDENYTEADVSSGEDMLEFPLNITEDFVFDYANENGVTVNNTGDIEAPITLVLDGPKTAPLEIENETTGEKIVLALSLLANERLTITTSIDDTNVIKEDISTGEETVAFQYIDVAETEFFKLVRGANTIKISAAEAEVEEATIKFKNRYVGV